MYVKMNILWILKLYCVREHCVIGEMYMTFIWKIPLMECQAHPLCRGEGLGPTPTSFAKLCWFPMGALNSWEKCMGDGLWKEVGW